MKYLFSLLILFFTIVSSIAQVNFTDSNLPILVINTDNTIVDEPKVEADLGIINNAGRNNISDAFNEYDGRIGIEYRGQTSQFFDKKSYGFETRDANGENLNVSLLGLPEENDWILQGPFSDKTMIRNVLIYDLSNEIGLYASRTQYCELVIDGDYKGVYVLMEKIKRDKNRVDIAKLTADEITTPEITGGYILKLDKYNDNDQNRFFSQFAGAKAYMEYQVIYPKPADLQTEQFDYIQAYMNDFESALNSEDYKDEILGYQQYIDVNSFVDFLIMNELGRNPDAYRISTYFYKENEEDGGQLKMGPVWDFNIGMGNADFCLGSAPSGWVFNYNQTCPDDNWLVGYWWKRFLSDPTFATAVIERWKTLRQTTFSIENIHQKIDDYAALLNESQDRNQQRWNNIGQWVWPNDFIGATYQEEVDYLKNWFGERVLWLDANIDFIYNNAENNQNVDFAIFPNPFQDELKLEINQAQLGETYFKVYDVLGHRVAAFKISVTPGIVQEVSIPEETIAVLSKGIYIYHFIVNDEIIYKGKLMKE